MHCLVGLSKLIWHTESMSGVTLTSNLMHLIAFIKVDTRDFGHHPRVPSFMMVIENGVSRHKVWWWTLQGVETKKVSIITMWVNNLWWLKIFNHPSLWLLKLFNHHRKKGGEGGGGCHIFSKALNEGIQNRCDKLAFYGNQKNLVTIGTLNWKFWLPQALVTEFFW